MPTTAPRTGPRRVRSYRVTVEVRVDVLVPAAVRVIRDSVL
jgi:hypothetical protein